MLKDVETLVLRGAVGGLMVGHGAQKLFGAFGGPGLKGTAGFMESLGMKPGKVWGTMAAVGEFSGGVFTLLGFLNPLGPLNIISAMTVATRRVHWKTPVWASSGGAELPLTNIAAALTVAMVGPGKYSLDGLFGIKLPKWATLGLYAGFGGMVYAALQRPEVAQVVMDKVMPKSSQRSAPAAGEQTATGDMPSGLQVENVATNSAPVEQAART